MMNPTGGAVRIDAGGNGNYGASRSKIVGGKKIEYSHQGMDLACIPGQDIRAISRGRFARLSFPYKDDQTYHGLVLETRQATFKIFYVKPDVSLLGKIVEEGDIMGKAQDISKKYPGSGVTPHIHIEIVACDPRVLFGTKVEG